MRNMIEYIAKLFFNAGVALAVWGTVRALMPLQTQPMAEFYAKVSTNWTVALMTGLLSMVLSIAFLTLSGVIGHFSRSSKRRKL